MGLFRQPFDKLVLGAGVIGCPFQMMGFIDHQNVPLCLKRAIGPARVLQKSCDAANDQLPIFKGIGPRINCGSGFAMVGINQGKEEVESP